MDQPGLFKNVQHQKDLPLSEKVARSVRELKIVDIAKAEMPFFIGYSAVFFLCVFSEAFCTFLVR